MASYFLKKLSNGLLVTSSKVTSKLQLYQGPELNLRDNPHTGQIMNIDLNGLTSEEFLKWLQMPELQFGFFPLSKPAQFMKMKAGYELPLTITQYKCDVTNIADCYNLCWAAYDYTHF